MTSFDVLGLLNEINERTQRIETLARRAVGLELTDARRDKAMAQGIDRLMEAARQDEKADNALRELFVGLAEEVRNSKGDDAKLDEIASGLEARAAQAFQLVTENTPFTPSGQ